MTPGGTSSSSGTTPRRRTRRTIWIVAVCGVLALALGVWLVVAKLPRFLNAPATGSADADSTTSPVTRRIQTTLFYLSDDGTQLVATSREVSYGATPAAQARQIVEAEVQPPPPEKQSPIPAGTTVRSVYLTAKGEAYVDLGGNIVSGHSGGSLDEALTVYAIVDAVTVNLPDVSAVQLLVNGKQVDTLVGHLDLRYPLAKTLDWVMKGP